MLLFFLVSKKIQPCSDEILAIIITSDGQSYYTSLVYYQVLDLLKKFHIFLMDALAFTKL